MMLALSMRRVSLQRGAAGGAGGHLLHRRNERHRYSRPVCVESIVIVSSHLELNREAPHDVNELQDATLILGGEGGLTVAAQRDATATASTSGQTLVQGCHISQQSSAPFPSSSPQGAPTIAAVSQTEITPGVPHPADVPAGIAIVTSRAAAQSDYIPPPPGADYKLHCDIKACSTWQDVLKIINDEAAVMAARTTVQALCRLQLLVNSNRPAVLAHPTFLQLVALVGTFIPLMNPLQLSNSLSALVKLKAPLPAEMLTAHDNAVAKAAHNFYPRDISTLLHAYSTLQHSPGQSVLDRLAYRAQGLLDHGQFEAQGISMLLRACVSLNYRNTVLLTAAAAAAVQVLPQATPQGVAVSALSLSQLDHFSDTLLEASADYAMKNTKRFKPQEAANLLSAFTRQRYHPQEALGALAVQLSSSLDSLKPADVSSLLLCMATFCVHPGDKLLAGLCKRMEAQLERSNAVELCTTFWALGIMGETEQPLFKRIGDQLPDSFQREGMNEGLMRQAFQGLVAARLGGKQTVEFPPLMMDACQRAWMTSIHRTGGAAARSYGGRHVGAGRLGVLRDILVNLKVPHDIRRPTQDGLLSIDVAIQAGRDRFVALQLLNEDDHTCNTGQMLGSVQLQRQVLERNGWEVRYLLARDLRSVAPEMQPMFLAELLRTAGVRVTVPQGPVDIATEAAAAAVAAGLVGVEPSDVDVAMRTIRPAGLKRGGSRGAKRGGGRA